VRHFHSRAGIETVDLRGKARCGDRHRLDGVQITGAVAASPPASALPAHNRQWIAPVSNVRLLAVSRAVLAAFLR